MPDQTSNPSPDGEPNPHALPPPPDSPVSVPGDPGAAPGGPEADQLDAANASLAGALAVSFSVLRIIMVLLILVFLLSGFFTVAPDEVAVRTRFGRIIPGPDGEVLMPEGGPYFRWPAPVGQVYRVPTTPRSLKIDESFVFRAARHSPDRPLSQMSQGPRLDPEYDGALLTADKSIVHARYEVTYRIAPDDAARFVRNIATIADLDVAINDRWAIFKRADELVRNAVEQAIVEDVAATTLDRFIKGGRTQSPAPEQAAPGAPDVEDAGEQQEPAEMPETGQAEPTEPQPAVETGAETGDETSQDPAGAAEQTEAEAQPETPVAEGTGQEDRVRVRAQAVLSDLGSGITLVGVSRTEQTVLSAVRDLMTNVQRQIAEAAATRNAAESLRNSELTTAAGPAWEAVLAVILAYEEASRLRDAEPERFEQAQQAVRATFNGETLGPVLQGLAQSLPEENPLRARLESLARRHGGARLGGRAGGIVGSAASEASSYVAALEAEADRFASSLATYRERPELVRHKLLSDAMQKIFSGQEIETSFVAPGAELRLLLGRDRQTELEEEARGRRERFERVQGGANPGR